MGIGFAYVVDIIRTDERQVQVARKRRHRAVDHPLLFDAVPLHLEKKVARPENVAIGGGGFDGLARLMVREALGHLSFQAAAQTDETFAVPGQQLFIDSRAVIKPFSVTRRHELDQVVIALVGFRQQHEMVRGLARIAAFQVPAARRHVDFAAQNGLHAVLPRMVVEEHRRKHVAVLGHRYRRHLHACGFIEQLVDAACAIEQRIFGVQMEVNEL